MGQISLKTNLNLMMCGYAIGKLIFQLPLIGKIVGIFPANYDEYLVKGPGMKGLNK